MKIDSIYINAFGKLKNKKIDLSDGFNIIYGENEDGKTTVTEFIKMMFYGTNGRGSTISKNMRKKYKPWDNSTPCGSIDFTHNNTKYRLERTFGAQNSSDKITLLNLDIGSRQSISGNADVGSEFFGLTMGAFEKSVFINNAVALSDNVDADGELNAKLSNLTSAADEGVSFEKITERLKKAEYDLVSKSGSKGILTDNIRAVSQLEEQKRDSEENNRKREELEKEILNLETQQEKLNKTAAQLFEYKKAANIKTRRQLLTDFISAAEKYEKIEKQLTLSDGTLADRNYTSQIRQEFNDCKAAQTIISDRQKELDNIKLEIENSETTSGVPVTEYTEKKEELNKQITALQEQIGKKIELSARINAENQGKKSKPNIALLVSGIVSAAICVALLPLSILFAAIFSVAAVTLIVLSFVLRKRPASDLTELEKIDSSIAEDNRKSEQLRRQISEMDAKINNAEVKINTRKSLTESRKRQADSLTGVILQQKGDLLERKAELLSFVGKYKATSNLDDAPAIADEIDKLFDAFLSAKSDAEHKAQGITCKNIEQARTALGKLPAADENLPYSDEEIERLSSEIADKRESITARIHERKGILTSSFKDFQVPAYYDKKIRELNSDIDEQKKYLESLKIAQETLNAAFGEMRRGFSGELESTALKYFNQITNGAYNDITVSKNFDIRVGDAASGSHEIDYLSCGAVSQAYFSLRLAVSELLGKDCGGLPIILDDIFAQYDTKRTKSGFDFLWKYAEKSQVIFFTCHDNYLTDLKKGTNIIDLRSL